MLRMAGLVHLTDWVQGNGQGYALTTAGRQALETPRQLALLRQGRVPEASPPVIRQEPVGDGVVPAWERGEAARTALLEPVVPVVTFTLMFLNFAVFLAGLYIAYRENIRWDNVLLSSPIPVLRQTGALIAEDVFQRNQWWRLLTCCFVHIGLVHLGVNMYSLYAVGPLLEQLWGRWRYLTLYLLAGIGGSCVALLTTPTAVLAGASGALWGILASLATWLFLNRGVLPPALVATWQRQLFTTFLLNVFLTFSVTAISKGAHFGGGAVGLLAAVPMDVLRFGRGRQKWLALAGVLMIPVICMGAVVYKARAERSKEAEFADVIVPRIQATIKGALSSVVQEGDESGIRDLEDRKKELLQASVLLNEAGPLLDFRLEGERQGYLKMTANLVQRIDLLTKSLQERAKP
jgi:membrane associated rhomboid family serine protease